MKRFWAGLHSLSAQMILTLMALVLLTAAAAGLPAMWLIREQLERQAWAQVTQGQLAARALYSARENELTGLAMVTAQRPTLRELLVQGEPEAVSTYLTTLQEGTGLDLVAICDADERTIAQSGRDLASNACAWASEPGFQVITSDGFPQAWFFAAHLLDSADGGPARWALVGVALDDTFATEMRAKTGLEHSVLLRSSPLVSSLASRLRETAVDPELPVEVSEDVTGVTFDLGGRPYYAAWLALGQEGLHAEMALDVTQMVKTRRRAVGALGGTILAVVMAASLTGMLLARRIGQPLAQLANAASGMSRENLDSPVIIKARVREVALLAGALDGARSDLKRFLSELREEKTWTDHLLEAIVEGIVTLDRAGHITYFSHGATRITGWQRSEVLGRSCDAVFIPSETDERFSKLIPSPGRRHKIAVELRDGRQATLAVTGARLAPPDSGGARVALVFRDVSEEEAVHRLLAHFLANVAHEFRTPLSALAASVELLLDQAPDWTEAELQELLSSLHLGVLGLQTLIDNLLEGASIEAGHFRVHPRSSDLGDIIADAIRMMQPLLDKHGQRLVVELPAALPVVQADPRRTVQVLVNLLSNASKYGPDDSQIEIRAIVQGELVRVEVADSGPGIPIEHRAELFRRFVYPSAGGDTAQVGIGLGLSVVKAIVEAHGGAVGVDDRAEGGSVFWLTLPLASGG